MNSFSRSVVARGIIVTLILGFTLVTNRSASGALVAYEGFGYAAGSSVFGQTGGINWGGAWSAGSVVASNKTGSLVYTDGLGNSLVTSSNRAFFSGVSGTSSPSRPLAGVRGADGTTTWISFLGLRVGPVTNSTPPIFRRVVSLQLLNNTTERLAIGRATTNATVPMDTWSIYHSGNGNNTAASAVSLSNAPASLLVLRVDHVSGNDNAYLFVNPTLGMEPGTNSSSAQLVGAADCAFNVLRTFAGNSTAAGIYAEVEVDEIRIGDTYADVTPFVSGSQLPGITVDLTNKIAQLCSAASFSVNATGSAPLNFHWFFNNAPAASTSNSLSLASVGTGDAGNYFVIVSNAVGSATSSVVSLTVTDTIAPGITQCASNQNVFVSGACQGIVPDFTGSVLASDCSGIASITQTPLAGSLAGLGPHSITLTVTDGSNNVATCNATLTVLSTNVPAIITCASNQWLNTDFNQQAVIPNLTGQVIPTDPCGSVPVAQSPTPGTIVGPGLHVVTFVVGSGAYTNICTATVTVNGRPIASNQSASTDMDAPLNLALGGTDAEGPLTFYILTNPAHGILGTLNSNLVTYTPDEGYAGADAFTFGVSDGQITSAVATVSITIEAPDISFPDGPQITKDGSAVLLVDYATLPLSARGGSLANPDPAFTAGNYSGQLARANFVRSEPSGAPLASTRFFVPDLNRKLYILDRTTRVFTSYINFQGVFPKFDNDPGFAGGLVCVQFDPGYSSNGVFYTVHTEDPGIAGTAVPTNSNLPGLNLSGGYTTTAVFNPPSGSGPRQAVLVEWTDTNINNNTFEGTAREILRVGFNSNIHPMGDLIFNPLAQPGDSDWRNLYISNGDGGSGESSSSRTTPQRLDAVQGKVLRITPDITLRPGDELAASGRYRIPTTGADPNPFVSLSLTGLKKEIFAYGFRNPHRMSWDPVSNKLVVDDIGLHAWEEVNIIHKGDNYGYSEREGPEQLFVGGINNGKTGSQVGIPFPTNDTLVVTGIVAAVTPTYPVAQYSHADGDAVASGFVYRGSLLPQLRGKYVFGEITTGRLLYCDLAEMIAKDDGVRTTVSDVHEIQVVSDTPYDTPDVGARRWRSFDLIALTYTNRGGMPGSQKLTGSAAATAGLDIDLIPYGGGRADIRLAQGGDGELYLISKSDGLIRQLTSALSPPVIESINLTGGSVALTWRSVPGWNYRVQYKTNLAASAWSDVVGDVTAAGLTAAKTNAISDAVRLYRVRLLWP